MINYDKFLHFMAGLILAVVLGLFFPLLGLLTGIAYGVGKEVYDYFNRDNHTVDANDAIATFVGSIVGYLVIIS